MSDSILLTLPTIRCGAPPKKRRGEKSDPTKTFIPGIWEWAEERFEDGEPRERDDEFYFLSFRLRDSFVAQYKDKQPKWGFPIGGGNFLGELVWFTKYSRVKLDGTKERFWEGCRRVIEGMYSIQKDHALSYCLPWDEEKAHQSAQEAYDRLFNGKWSPPGRGFWVMGTFFVNGKKSAAALQNCAFLSTQDIANGDPTFPFYRLMEMSMLGIGVGFDTQGAGAIILDTPDPMVVQPVIVDDSREGWYESLNLILSSYFEEGKPTYDFDYSEIRPSGMPIKGFGGTSAGPEPLRELHERIRKLLGGRKGHVLTSSDIVDIMNMIGRCVVAANVRSSAEIALGEIKDVDFLQLKDPQLHPERMGFEINSEGGLLIDENGNWTPSEKGGWGYTSNNSVIAKVGDKYDHLVDNIKLNGEPGIIWLDVCRNFGRIHDNGSGNKDHRVMGVNPCLTADTWIMTVDGPRQISELIGNSPDVLVNGKPFTVLSSGFFKTGTKSVFELNLDGGISAKMTADHQVLTQNRGWVEAQSLTDSDLVVLHDHIGASWGGQGSFGEGYLLGYLWGDGTFNGGKAVLSVWGSEDETLSVRSLITEQASYLPHRSDWKGFSLIEDRNEWRLGSASIKNLASSYGMVQGNKKITDAIEKTSSEFYRGFLRAAFDADGHIEGTIEKGVSIRLSQSDYEQLQRIQRMLGRLGIRSVIRNTRPDRESNLPDGHGGKKLYSVKASWRLIISGDHAQRYMDLISFEDPAKVSKWHSLTAEMSRGFYPKPLTAKFESLVYAGIEDVYDVTVADVHAFDANGIYVHNCAEQSLEHSECCTLVETYPTNCKNKDDFVRTLKFAYLYGKTVTLLPTHWAETNEVMMRNRRIGTSITGLAEFVEKNGWDELRQWQDAGYKEIKNRDTQYSEWLGIRESIKVTTVKPSGTVSLLFGVTPGCHWPNERGFYLRRMRESKNNPIVKALADAGYHVEDNLMNPEYQSVITFPTKGPDIRPEHEVPMWEKTALAAQCQEWWSDNAVSVTVTFNPETEGDQIPALLRAFEGKLKTVSFLPSVPGVYAQAPYEKVDRKDWKDRWNVVEPINWDSLYDAKKTVEAEGEKYCSNDSCSL